MTYNVFSGTLNPTHLSPAKTAEPIEMPFGVWNWAGPRNHVLDEGPDHHIQRGNFDQKKSYLHGKWLAKRARSTILRQQLLSFRETMDEVHFSCKRLCRKETKYGYISCD